ncbi:hypothetical protein [Rathayibacter sp. VKM Ac-2927]|uniref:hypothetical protein n=1 Tax=Rathayibacter sp. VKM Ac-2927 TaxID=2929478 RepID=UPI001FB25151|nr:hypothetical protein [Rathayibacter sp. VKM Ac-2927]MCJ1687866.1 hypothetical protein [Rathayibacter sp. VKM Ac-2927]
MTISNLAPSGLVGTTVHVRKAGTTVRLSNSFMSPSTVFARGDEFVVTNEVLEAGLDRNGALPTWVRTLDDPSAPIGRGPWPDDASKYVRGSIEWVEARESARQRAWALPGRAEQAEALREVEREFGPSMPTHSVIQRTRGEGEAPLHR